MRKILLLITISMLIILQLTGCNAETKTESSFNIGLSFEDAILAKKVDGSWEAVKGTKFVKGDTVGLVFLNVSGFKKGEDGLNWMDIDVEVKDTERKVILDEKGLLGDSGKMVLENNIANSPVGSFTTNSDLVSGSYNIKVTVHDKIGGGKAMKSMSFILE